MAEVDEGFASQILRSFGYTPELIQSRFVAQGATRGLGSPESKMPLRPEAAVALEHSIVAADRFAHAEVDTGHLLLGLLSDRESVASAILSEGPANTDLIRTTTEEMFGAVGQFEVSSLGVSVQPPPVVPLSRDTIPTKDALVGSFKRIRVWMVVSWVLSAVSVINLLSNIELVRIRSDVFNWINAYSRFVERFSNFLFDWMEFWRLELTKPEDHTLAIVAVLVGTALRADNESIVDARNRPGNKVWENVVFLAVFCFLVAGFLAVIADPPSYLIVLGSIFALGIFFVVHRPEYGEDTSQLFAIYLFLRHLPATILLVGMVVAADYVLVQ